jgi:RNA polymerase sigma-70 factor (ECF subfamily)
LTRPDAWITPSRPEPPEASIEAERALVRRCVRGDGLAWRTLYDRHFPQVDRLVHALGITDNEADDVCQEIFVSVFRSLASFRGDARVSTWIHRVAVREAVRWAKRRRMRRVLAALFLREQEAAPPPSSSETEAGRRQYLRRLLDRLAPERRLALVLHEIEGLPVGEIAALSGCAENTVWTRIHRARGDLERMAEAEGGGAR